MRIGNRTGMAFAVSTSSPNRFAIGIRCHRSACLPPRCTRQPIPSAAMRMRAPVGPST